MMELVMRHTPMKHPNETPLHHTHSRQCNEHPYVIASNEVKTGQTSRSTHIPTTEILTVLSFLPRHAGQTNNHLTVNNFHRTPHITLYCYTATLLQIPRFTQDDNVNASR